MMCNGLKGGSIMGGLLPLLLVAVLIHYLWENARGLFWFLFWVFIGIPVIIACTLAVLDNDPLYVFVKFVICDAIPILFRIWIVQPLQQFFNWLKDFITGEKDMHGLAMCLNWLGLYLANWAR